MSEMSIRPVRVHEDGDLQAWYDVYRAAETHERPFASPWMLEEVTVAVRSPSTSSDRVSLLGTVDGVPVCAGSMIVPLRDNLDSAAPVVHTHPLHRRRGHARAMLAALEAEALSRGRTRMDAMLDYAYETGPEGLGDPGAELMRACGYALGLSDVQRTLQIPLDPAMLEALAAEAAPHHADYPLVDWQGRCPDRLVDSFARLIGLLVTEAPTGELEQDSEHHDAARVRESERVNQESGRRTFVTAALTPEGEVVAYTQMTLPLHDRRRVYQWGTLVRRDHRGHRLGLAVKVANHRRFQELDGDAHEVVTFNAEVNDHMIAVNERLGFIPSARGGEFQKRLRAAQPPGA